MLTAFTMNAYSASKTIVVLGDSLSAEYGLARGEGWVSLLQKKLEAEKISAPIVNASISGETTSGGAARLQALLDKHQPAVVVIELGANDALRGLSLIATQQNLRTMVAASKKAKAKVLLVGMQIPPNYGTDYTRQFAELYPKIAKETKSALVPFMLKDVADKANLFQADRIHPSAEAHPVILNNIWPQLKPLLAK
nr:arylesterase [Janthinobacterium sp. Marseille]